MDNMWAPPDIGKVGATCQRFEVADLQNSCFGSCKPRILPQTTVTTYTGKSLVKIEIVRLKDSKTLGQSMQASHSSNIYPGYFYHYRFLHSSRFVSQGKAAGQLFQLILHEIRALKRFQLISMNVHSLYFPGPLSMEGSYRLLFFLHQLHCSITTIRLRTAPAKVGHWPRQGEAKKSPGWLRGGSG